MKSIKFIVLFLFLHAPIIVVGGILGAHSELWYSTGSSFFAGAGLVSPIAFIFALFTVKRCAAASRFLRISTSLVLGLVIALWFLLCFPAAPEGKCFFNPDIDTRFAPGYSDQAFQQVSIGMNESDVISLLGEPMHKQEPSISTFPGNADVIWWYSQDGACSWDDCAWRAPIVGLKEGKVASKWTTWCYD